ncbi:hypothetical protein ACFO9Q_03865 [Paenibacillus sp. GCM10023252]|uniref:hypothetical protein n=1 Tax=Paenibacillus sp. GCM10023252 TaxID=3252649 RepID=UPI00361ECAB1
MQSGMNKVVNSVALELSMLFRNWICWIVYVLGLGEFGFIVFMRLASSDIGGALTATGAVIQGGVFAFLILGYFLIRKETANHSDEVFNSIKSGFIIKGISKIITILVCVLLFTTIAILLTVCIFIYYGVPGLFYLEMVKYITLYYTLPFIISGLIGIWLGSFFKSRYILILIILTGVTIGPLNSLIFKNLMAVISVDLSPLLTTVNISQSDVGATMDPIYGYALEWNRWVHMLIWLVCLSMLLVIRGLYHQRRNSIRILLPTFGVAGILLISSFIYLSQPSQVIKTLNERDSVRNYDKSYYAMQIVDQVVNEDENFLVNSYVLDLNINRSLEANAKLNITLVNDADTFDFVLYHRFEVKRVTNDKGEVLEYAREGDHLTVWTQSMQTKGQKVDITIEYAGLSSPYFFVNELAVMLPSYFAWYPYPGNQPSMIYTRENKLQVVPLQPTSNEITYTVNYQIHPSKVYSNLSMSSDHTLSGKSNQGITFLAGQLSKIRVQDIDVVYPTSLYKNMDSLRHYISQTEKNIALIEQDLGIENRKPRQSYFLLSVPYARSIGFVKSTWLRDDHMIFSVSHNLNNGSIFGYEAMNIGGLTSSIIRTPELIWDVEQEDQFLNAYSYWFEKKHEIEQGNTPNLERLIDATKNNKNDKHHHFYLNLKEWLDVHYEDQDRLSHFFQEWKQMLLDQKDNEQIMTFVSDELNKENQGRES